MNIDRTLRQALTDILEGRYEPRPHQGICINLKGWALCSAGSHMDGWELADRLYQRISDWFIELYGIAAYAISVHGQNEDEHEEEYDLNCDNDTMWVGEQRCLRMCAIRTLLSVIPEH